MDSHAMHIGWLLASDAGGGHSSTLLVDIGLCIVAATVLAYIGRLIRQPLILAYIGAGVAIGPYGFKLISDSNSILTLSEIGLALLMFIVGLEIDAKKLVSAGKKAAITTVFQVAGCAVLGWLTAILLGYDGLPAVYISLAVAFSSTMIVLKLLADRGELDTLPGGITLAILLFQDVFAIVALAVQPNLGGGADVLTIVWSIAKGLGLAGATMLVAYFFLPILLRAVAMVPEMLLLTAVSWCFVICFVAMELKFSVAMGALIAGVSISTLPYTMDVAAKISSLRDFFVTLFFVSLGLMLVPPGAGQIMHTIVLAAVVVVSRFLLVWPPLRILGLDNRTGALSSIHLAQTSEFGLVIAMLGAASKHISPEVVSLIVVLLIVTSTLSTYMIQWSHPLSIFLMRVLGQTPLKDRYAAPAAGHSEGGGGHGHGADVVIVGCFRTGFALAPRLQQAGRDFMVIDFNPIIHAEMKSRGIPCIYGDISHKDTLEHAGVSTAKVLVSSISDDFLRNTSNRKLLETLRKLNPGATIIVTAESPAQALDLYRRGADFVLLPRLLAAGELVSVVDEALGGTLRTRRERMVGDLILTQDLDSTPAHEERTLGERGEAAKGA